MNTLDSRPLNHLAHEKSPYLQQHADNPVNWYPWGEAAFELARREGKLIFLSIGYSTCHWCHVMAHESFEDDDVAKALERNYVAVKVDREERPDIDQVYMEICQRLTGRGGWPLTVVLRPDGLPVFAATYLPKPPRPGYDGLIALLDRIAIQAEENASQLREAGQQLLESMAFTAAPSSNPVSHAKLFEAAASELRRNFDPAHGGFGRSPKFPTPHNLRFLVQHWWNEERADSLQMAEQTLTSMSQGGLFDHLGGGFHRYSTDQRWLVPHFEKMLYDQAGLSDACIDALIATGRERYAKVARATLDYVCTELADPAGGLHAAEDADSEGEEGLFYLWRKKEIDELLDQDLSTLFCDVYTVAEAGNYHDESTGQLTGLNILHRTESLSEFAEHRGLPLPQLREQMTRAREILLHSRQKRLRPHRDDKILCAWNGMMIAALSRAGRHLGRDDYLDTAENAARFILDNMRSEEGRLLRRWRDGEAAIPAFAEDYACFVRGLLELYPSRFEPQWLVTALELAEDLHRLFTPAEGGALFDTGSDAEKLVTRPRTLYDGAMPSANAVALEVFARLYRLTGDTAWRERADSIFAHLAPLAQNNPQAFSGMLFAANLLHGNGRELVIVGDPDGEDTQALLKAARTCPDTTLTLLNKQPDGHDLDEIAPYTREMTVLEGKATAYLCSGQSCQQPTSEPENLQKQLAMK